MSELKNGITIANISEIIAININICFVFLNIFCLFFIIKKYSIVKIVNIIIYIIACITMSVLFNKKLKYSSKYSIVLFLK